MYMPTMFQLLRVAVLWFYLLPLLLCDNLLCYYSPILEKEISFELIVTECPPDELCFKADGRYGNHSALSSRGCMLEEDCGQVHSLRLKGTIYTLSFTCCNWAYCNSCPNVTTKLSITVALVTVAVIAAGSL